MKNKKHLKLLCANLFLWCLIIPNFTFAQELILPIDQNQIVLSEKAQKIFDRYQNKPSTIELQVVQIDFEALAQNQFTINYPNHEVFRVQTLESTISDAGYKTQVASTRTGIDITITSKEDQLIAKFEDKDGITISLLPLENGLHILMQSKGQNESICGAPPIDPNTIDEIIENPSTYARNDNNCKVRLLITFTDDAVDDIGIDLHLFAQSLISEANSAFINSGVSLRFELAAVRVYEVNESLNVNAGCRSIDLQRFFDNTAPYNFIDVIRDNYQADLCLLMISDNIFYPGRCTTSGNNGTLFGQVISVGTDDEDAFAVASLTAYEDGRYTVIHELGHIMGAAHDNGSSYRRGYLFETAPGDTQQRRTIMCRGSVGNCSQTNSCRVLYFSNPDIIIGGNRIGVEDANDNSRWLEEKRNTIRNYRENSTNLTINATTIGNNILGNYTADTRITTNGNVVCASGGHMNFRAGNNIELNNGFTINNGAEFAAIIGNCNAVYPTRSASGDSNSDFEDSSIIVEIEENQLEESLSRDQLRIIPNPTKGFAEIRFSLDKASSVQIRLLDMNGKFLFPILESNLLAEGPHQVQFNKSLPNGIYYINLQTENRNTTSRMIIMQ